MLKYLLLKGLISVILVSVSSLPYDKNQTVKLTISNGVIQGKNDVTENGKIYYSFQGIPFADPPLGPLRFKAPKPIGNWSGILDATKEQSTCIELTEIKISKVTIKGEENCLYINVFTPKDPNNVTKKLPVMVWIYGGAFVEGNSKYSNYGPDYLLEEDVIVVTFNYRIGIFGFLSTEDMQSPGNYGLKDQLLALKWVNKNINFFGGDKNDVTIFGQSAGSASVAYHLQSPRSQGLFHKAIAESGSSLCNFAFQRQPLQIALDIRDSLKLQINSTKDLITQLRKMEANELAKASHSPFLLNFVMLRHYGMPFAPTLEPPHKNAFFTEPSFETIKKGQIQKIPMIMGHTSNEAVFFNNEIKELRPFTFINDISPGNMITPNMNVKTLQEKREAGLKILKFYFEDAYLTGSTEAEFIQFASDDTFVRPIEKHAKLIYKNAPLYFYVFSHEGIAGPQSLAGRGDPTRTLKGAAHSEEMAYLWKKADVPFFNEEDKLTSKRMVKMWTNFAKTGNPTPIQDELLENILWPTVESAKNLTYLSIEDHLILKSNFRKKEMNFWDGIHKKYANRPFITY